MKRRLAIARSLVNDLADRIAVLPDRLLLYARDGEAVSAAVHERGLEDVFLRLTGRTLVD